MPVNTTTEWESAVLDGGPADGVRMLVTGRPRVVQVTYPCKVDGTEVQADGVYVYRLDYQVTSEPLRYGYDIASP